MIKGVYRISNTLVIEVELISLQKVRYKEPNPHDQEGEWVEADLVEAFQPVMDTTDFFGDIDIMDADIEDIYDYLEESTQTGFYVGNMFIPLCDIEVL